MLNEMKVVELKEMLKSRGLKVSGRKAELIERIQEFDEAVNEYNENVENLINGHGAMYDYIAKNITNEIDGATGGDFMRSRINDVLEADDGRDVIENMIYDVESLLDFYLNGGNDHTASEINEVRQFLNFLKNVARHTEVKSFKAHESVESDVAPAQDEEDETPAQDITEQATETVKAHERPTINFDGKTAVGRVAIVALSNGLYDIHESPDSADLYVINDVDLMASETLDDVTIYVTDGRVVQVSYVSRGAEFIVTGEQLSKL